MDAAQVVIEEVPDIFAGLTFTQACNMLFAKCKSNAPSSEGFQNMIDYIRGVHEAMGLEFDCNEYWNVDTFSGSHPVFPPGLGASFNTLPDELSREYLIDLIGKIGDLEAANTTYRQNHERIGSSRGRSTSGGIIDTRTLQRSVNTAPIYLAVSEQEDEDDFI